MKVLVSGGAGYVGSTSAQRLLEAGHEVVVLDSLELGHAQAVPDGAELIVGNMADAALVERTLREQRIEAVLHCAGYSLVGESVEQPQRYLDNNVAGGSAFFGALRAAGVDRVAFSSSAAVYGEPVRVPIEERDALAPINPYGETKLAVEQALTAHARADGWRVVSLRYFNAAGATNRLGEAHDPETHLIPNILGAVERGETFRLFGDDYPTPDGTCIRDYVHVDDLAAAHIAALELTATLDSGHVICNLGSGTGSSNLEVLRSAEKVLGRRIDFEFGPRRAGDPPVLVASNGKARELFGWSPRQGIEAMIRSAWEWRRGHPGGYAAAG